MDNEHEVLSWIGKSLPIQKILASALRVAKVDSPVLILGESGTGKELLAENIHRWSLRAEKSFIKINCAAIPTALIETEFFGYIKGAFTDASQDKKGLFERAHTGTLLLDEVADLDISAQSKLLRILQEKKYHRVGDSQEQEIDVRIISASNIDLTKAVKSGKFRHDLYYRLAVLPLEIPPLRERAEDTVVLAQYFLSEIQKNNAQAPKDFSLTALEGLLTYPWPGNVRELRNAVERAAITGQEKKITLEDLGLIKENNEKKNEYKGRNLKNAMTTFKKKFISDTLFFHKGNQTRTAQALGIQRTYLSRIMKELKIVYSGEKK